MSRLEAQLKPVLLALLKKESLWLSPIEQKLLSKWICMKVMVAEQAQVETRVTPDLDLKVFYKNQEIPSYFTVFIGRHTSGVHTWFSRYTATFSLKKDRYDPPLNGLTKNSQSVTFLIGPLVVHVLASRVSGFDLGGEFKYPTLNRIWPIEMNDLEWPFAKVTTENGIGAIANSFDAYLKAPNVTYGGPLRKE